MSGTISFPGLSTSQDFASVMEAMVDLRRNARVAPLEEWKTSWETKLETIDTVDSTLSAFYTEARGMDRISEFMVRSAASSDEDVLSATASSDATVGTHTVLVNQLAKAEVEVHRGIQNGIQYHSGVDDKTASINDSGVDKTFKYSYDGSTRTLTVADGDSLEDLRDAINADGANPGVTAKIVTSGDEDHLVLVETTPDPANEILVDPDDDMTLDGSSGTTDLTASAFTQTVNASGSDQVFALQYGSDAAVEITVPTGTTLSGLKDLIDAEDMGIRASLLNDGGSGTGAVHLVLTGEDTGEDYAITLNPGAATTLDGTSDTEDFTDLLGVFTASVSAQDAQVRVDGYPSSGWIERAGNTLTDVIEGLTLSLVDTGTATVTTTTDAEAIVEKVQAFTEAFNAVRTAIREATYYDSETGEKGTLLGNYAMQIVKSRLDSFFSGAAPGFRDPDDAYSTLQQVGFSTDATEGSETQGLLLLDTDALEEALADDPDAVANLFSAYLDGSTDDSQIAFYSTLYTATPGIYDVEVDTDTGQGRFRLEGGDWGAWYALSGSSGDYYLTGTSGPEKGVGLHVTYGSGTGTHSAEFRLKSGVVTSLSGELENLLGTSGPLVTLTANYNDILDNIDARIEEEERRLDLYEEALTLRFARLDKYLSQMTSLSSMITAMTPKSSTK